MIISENERNLLQLELFKLSRNAQAVVTKLLIDYDKHKCLENLELEDLPGEIWKWISGYENLYQISNKTRVKSFHNKTPRILHPGFNSTGYPSVNLKKNGKATTYTLHRLVAVAFIPNPLHLPEVDHIDGNRGNCKIDNLRWVTPKENIQANIERGTHQSGTKSVCARFNEDEVRYIRSVHIPYDQEFGISALARKFNVTGDTIKRIVHHITYKDVE